MYTQCPHCQTLFCIRKEQLRAADGQAHCCQCGSVFNALKNLREYPNEQEVWPEPSQIDGMSAQQNLPLDELSYPLDSHKEAVLNNLTDLLKALESDNVQHLLEDKEQETGDTREQSESEINATDPDSFPIDLGPDPELSFPTIESRVGNRPENHLETPLGEQTSSPFGSDDAIFPIYESEVGNGEQEPSETSILDYDGTAAPSDKIADEVASQQTISTEKKTLPFDLPENLPDIPPSDAALSLSRKLGSNSGKKSGTLGWSLIIIALLIVALGQAAWFGREHLIRYPEGRQLLQFACNYANCQLPLVKATEKITIISRSINTHPDAKGVLLVLVTFVNRSAYPQPYPHLQLTLFGSNDQLAARRIFQTSEYLKDQADTTQPLQPNQIIQVEMAVKDPGENVTGFKFDFL